MTEEQQNSARNQLRTERESQHLSAESVSSQLNLSLETIELLETNDFSKLPPPTFTRGYLRAYAKLLGIDDSDLMLVYNEYAPADPDLAPADHVTKETKSSHPAVRWVILFIVVVIFTLLGFWWIGPRDGIDDVSKFETLSDQAVDEPRTETPAPVEIAESPPEGESASQSSGDTVQSDDAQAEPVAVADSEATQPNPLQSDDAQSEDPAGEDVTGGDVASEVVANEVVANEVVANEVVANEVVANEVVANEDVPTEAAQIDRENVPAESGQTPQQNESPIGQMSESGEVEADPTVATIAVSESHETVAVASEPAIAADIRAAIAADAGEPIVVGDDELQLQAESESWVEVIDANGVRLMYEMLTKTRERRLRGTAPFKVFLGNTPGISMVMNGITVATPRYNSISNTSRFIVNADGGQRRQR